jgi:hypothetical protein
MQMIGCDLHARQQTLAILDTETGEFEECVLEHARRQQRTRRLRPRQRFSTQILQWYLPGQARVLHTFGASSVGHQARELGNRTIQQSFKL